MRRLYTHLLGRTESTNGKNSSVVPKIFLMLFGFGLLVLVLQLFSGKGINTRAADPPNQSSVSFTCTSWNKGATINSHMVVHKFSNFDECKRAWENGDGAALVGKIDGCDINNNYCINTASCTADNRVCDRQKDPNCQDAHYSCGVSSNVPSCSVAQLDCLSGINGAGGAIAWNCGGCRAPTPPPPPPPVRHKECVNQACKVVNGAGDSTCRFDTDCQVQTHNECEGLACVVKRGPGANQCRLNSNDCVPVKHNVCENEACVSKMGPGRNECSSDRDCRREKTHLECRNESCRRVSGDGGNSCSNDSDCRPVRNQNAICDSLSVNPQSGNKNLSVSASLSGHTENGGSIVSYKFNFGDGTGDFMQSGQNLSHSYNAVGTFVVNGYVTDDRGNQAGGSGSCQKMVTVSAPGVTPPPPGQVLGAIPRTGAETALVPMLFGTGVIGWAIRKLKIKK